MTDFSQHRESGSIKHSGGESAVQKADLDYSRIMQSSHQDIPRYTAKDVKTVNQMADDATKMLGTLEIDHKPGVSRNELIKAEGNKKLSNHDGKVLDGMLNLEPSIQEAWQVPDHRKHLMELSEARFYHSAASTMLKHDAEWASRLEKQAVRMGAEANRDLQADRKAQVDVYFNQGAMTPDKLAHVKEEAQRVTVALQVFSHVDKTASDLLGKLHKGVGGSLTTGDVDAALKDKHLSAADRVVLTAVSKYQYEVGGSNTDSARNIGGASDSTLNRKQLSEVIFDWANAETRADGKGSEALFFRSLEGYNGNGLKITANDRLNRELDAKNSSQLIEDGRNNNFRSIPLAY